MLTVKRGQSSVNVSYSPPSPHTFIPYSLPRTDNNKPITLLCLKHYKKKEKEKIDILFQLMQIGVQGSYFFAQVFRRVQPQCSNLLHWGEQKRE